MTACNSVITVVYDSHLYSEMRGELWHLVVLGFPIVPLQPDDIIDWYDVESDAADSESRVWREVVVSRLEVLLRQVVRVSAIDGMSMSSGQTDGQTDRRTDGRTDRQTD